MVDPGSLGLTMVVWGAVPDLEPDLAAAVRSASLAGPLQSSAAARLAPQP